MIPDKLVSGQLFWGRSSGDCKWYNLILRVDGSPPFCKVMAWTMFLDDALGYIDPNSVLWGPEIKRPMPDSRLTVTKFP